METILSIYDVQPKEGQKIKIFSSKGIVDGVFGSIDDNGVGIVNSGGKLDLFEEYTTNFSRINDILNENGLEVVYRDDYSGRGMMGEQTEAIVADVDKTTLEKTLRKIQRDTRDKEISKDIDMFLVDLFTDTMGKNSTIYYKKY